MLKWFKQLFCKHHKVIIVGDYLDRIEGNHFRKKYIHKCKDCGKEWM